MFKNTKNTKKNNKNSKYCIEIYYLYRFKCRDNKLCLLFAAIKDTYNILSYFFFNFFIFYCDSIIIKTSLFLNKIITLRNIIFFFLL